MRVNNVIYFISHVEEEIDVENRDCKIIYIQNKIDTNHRKYNKIDIAEILDAIEKVFSEETDNAATWNLAIHTTVLKVDPTLWST